MEGHWKKEKKIILHIVLHGCKTWPLTLREGHRLRVGFEVFTAVVMKGNYLLGYNPV
jgi:hypothetical protein